MEREGNIFIYIERERREREKETMMKQSASNVKSRQHIYIYMLYKHDKCIQIVYLVSDSQNEATSAQKQECICNNT